ncbi:Biotin biosynthesis bifunctional protein BioAB [Seminavis robusta]|uniref:Biotin biosynthesis bifunctional protein BioAB n=1 Tax=Seminavis robusta TaxID=568900 RepID=A0A9N8EZT5_9STRA|nr:Biotin biosynthesis bifunctional protein BioAB [Seminavis robusta]|eukprot:Sro2134_g315950.1 Biotin biosynthesis bifunctional protein BioAB (440) ;mRNA; r:12921-14240
MPPSSLTPQEIIDLDQQHVWHPYAAMPNGVRCFPVHSAKGVEIELTDGRTLVDGMSSWWAAIHGYNHPVLNNAATQQMERMSHVMFGGLTHEPAVQLAQKLVQVTPSQLQHVFYCDSGSVSIEVAMKMALQYWHNLGGGDNRKHRFLTVRGGYHGDTFKAMSVCDPVNGMHHLFSSVLASQIFVPRPQVGYYSDDWDESDLDQFKQTLEQHQDEIAAVILEPIVQGAGGMHFYHPNYLRRVRELCDEYNVLLILDEIATGFGRTGTLFASEHANIQPDILCLGKALSGGFLSFAATMTTTKISQVFAQGEAGVFMHGPTFMGNPLACAVSLASLNLLLDDQNYNWKQKVHAIEQQLQTELEPCRESPLVQDVRVLGAIGVVEMKEPFDMRVMQPKVVDQGIWLRPFGKLLYTMPPFIMEAHQLRKITQAMVALTRRKFP